MKESKDLCYAIFFNNYLLPFDINGKIFFFKQQLKAFPSLTG